jgi:tetratricopeptide (TPR) repeat protein
MKRLVLTIPLFVLLHCGSTYVEEIVHLKGSVLEIDSARFEVQENSVEDSILLCIEKKSVGKRDYEQGFSLLGESFAIKPETLFFRKPIRFSLPARMKNVALGVKIAEGFVPIAESKSDGKTLRAEIWHGGEYYVIRKPEKYGIKDHAKIEQGMLIVTDIYVSDYIRKFKNALRQGGYDLPIWTFIYSNEKSIEENTLFLTNELNKLHEQYGNFRLDIVSFGVGGLITHRYVVDTSLYQNDVSPAIIAIGTPFFGSNFADLDNLKKGRSPYRFFFIDGLGEYVKDLELESDFISWMKKHRSLPGWRRKKLEENKNFASIMGKKLFEGDLPEEIDGDGLISSYSTMLTPIEPEPFDLAHFDLYEDAGVHKVVGDFVQLYRSFNWPLLFTKVWRGEEDIAKISEIWSTEARLNYRKKIDFEVLLEFNENMLKSAPKNAILITNGDNDTYPAWYLQEKGVRRDVMIVNRHLLNTTDCIRFLIKNGLPIDLPREKIDNLQPYKDKDTGEIVMVLDLLIELLLQQQTRPIVFASTVYKPERYGYPLKLSGLVYEVGDEEIDIHRTQELLHQELKFDRLFSTPLDSLNPHLQHMAKNYAAVAFQLSLALEKKGEHEEALQEIRFAKRFSNEPVFLYNEAMMYFNNGIQDIADSIFREVLGMSSVDLNTKKLIAQRYHEMDKKKEAIRILAECLKDNPEDREIPALIEKYQEK